MVTNNAVNTESLEFVLCQSANALSTGILTGGEVTVNGGDPAKFDISAGTGYVVNNYTNPAEPVITRVSFGPFTAQTITNLATATSTFVSIDSSGSIVQQTTSLTQPEKRDLITLSVIGHSNNTSITAIGPIEEFAADVGVQLSDFAVSIGNINREGNVFGPNGANLNLDKTAGETFRLGANFNTSAKNPNIVEDPSATGLTFTYLYRDGSGGTTVGATGIAVDPDQYDDGTGTLATVPNNRWTIQRITFFTNSNFNVIEYGQNIYSSLSSAEGAIQTEVFENAEGLERGSFRAWMIVKKNTTDLSDGSENTFVEAGKFGSVSPSGGGGGGGLTDLQGAYNNSVDPEIVVDSLRGALTVTDASTPIGANLFEVDNNAQTTTYFAVDATGAQIDGALTITTPLAASEGGNGSVTLTQGSVSNLGITYSAGTFTVQGSQATLSSTNVATVVLPSKTTPGELLTYTVTADQSFIDDAGASEIINNLFGLTTSIAYTEDIPFYLYAVANDAEDTIQFMISRNPSAKLSPVAAQIGAPDDAVADQQYSFFSFDNIDETLYDENPCVCVGAFRMQMSSSDDWTVQTISNNDGIGLFHYKTLFTMPRGTFGAVTNSYVSSNGGTEPTFDAGNVTYKIDSGGMVDYCFSPGVVNNSPLGSQEISIVLPYALSSNSGRNGIQGTYKNGTTSTRVSFHGTINGGTQLVASMYLEGTSTKLNNGSFAGNFSVYSIIRYPAFA